MAQLASVVQRGPDINCQMLPKTAISCKVAKVTTICQKLPKGCQKLSAGHKSWPTKLTLKAVPKTWQKAGPNSPLSCHMLSNVATSLCHSADQQSLSDCHQIFINVLASKAFLLYWPSHCKPQQLYWPHFFCCFDGHADLNCFAG